MQKEQQRKGDAEGVGEDAGNGSGGGGGVAFGDSDGEGEDEGAANIDGDEGIAQVGLCVWMCGWVVGGCARAVPVRIFVAHACLCLCLYNCVQRRFFSKCRFHPVSPALGRPRSACITQSPPPHTQGEGDGGESTAAVADQPTAESEDNTKAPATVPDPAVAENG